LLSHEFLSLNHATGWEYTTLGKNKIDTQKKDRIFTEKGLTIIFYYGVFFFLPFQKVYNFLNKSGKSEF
jgi:hypothetical protein